MCWLASATTLHDVASVTSWSDGVIQADPTVVAVVIGVVAVAAGLYLLRRFWSRKRGGR